MNQQKASAKSPEIFRRLSWLSLIGCLSLLAFLSGCAKHAHTETPNSPPVNARSSGDVVKVKAAPLMLSAGGSGSANITLSISPGYHVNANPATFDYLIATQVTPGTADGITAGKPVYPAAVKQKFQFAEEPLAVYEGDTQIKLPLSSPADAARGQRSLPLNIRVQACDQEKCFPPDTLRATVPVEIK